jgi:carboxypeptidase C (cathepsin A)/predicted metalloprotease with PDZ domain
MFASRFRALLALTLLFGCSVVPPRVSAADEPPAVALALPHAVSVAALPPASDSVSDEPPIGPISTQHEISIGGTRLPYTATFAEMPLTDESGRLQATISSTSYVLEHVRDRSRRPVLFLFNGGPGASSSPLHFSAFGPRRLTEERDAPAGGSLANRSVAAGLRKLADNPHTLLDLADLVFIDPVGTGFSRERPGVPSGTYWSVESDAASVLQLIRKWRVDNGRSDSPLFIAGESYGGFRLATLLGQAADLPITGVIFISPLLDASGTSGAPGNDLPYILSLPSMAVAAWEHNKIDRAGRTIEQVYAEAEHFAQSDYAVALQQGSLLPAPDRERLAGRIAALIGLPAETIAADNLRVGSQEFLEKLLSAEGRIVGRLDTRVSAPKVDPTQLPNRPAAANDPALGLGPTNLIKSEAIKAYMERELGVQTTSDYLSLTLDVNFHWSWQGETTKPGETTEPRFYINSTPNITSAMVKQPRMRLLLVGGYYDMAVPLLAPRYALTHAGVPLDRVSMQALVAPHSAFEADSNLATGTAFVHDFLRSATAAALAPPAALSILIRPAPVSNDGRIASVDITETFDNADVPVGTPLLTMSLVSSNVESVAKKLTDFSAADTQGALTLVSQDDAATDPAANRRWVATRAVRGEVTIHYRAPIDNAPQVRGSGPPFGIRTEAGGFSGLGRLFVILPCADQPYHIKLRWDLAALGSHASAMSSFGHGDIDLPSSRTSRVADAYFMAGALHRYPQNTRQGGFASAWLGSPPFDATQLMAWTAKLNGWYTHFFGGDASSPYGVFMRYNPVNPGGGVELPNSFVATFDEHTRADDLQLTLAHEMLHTWGPRLQPEGFLTQWFPEGTAVFYQRVLPLRAGLLSPQRYLDDLNKSAVRYYTNSLISAPNQEIGKRFWEDTRIRVLPYDRGSFYFAVVNDQVRKASGGKRSLDDLILDLARRERHGEQVDGAGWVTMVEKQVGPMARTTYESMLAGGVMLPDSDAFGPCFERTTRKFRRFDLGFDSKSLISQPRIVHGLVPGSAAAAAGLRDGDEIAAPVGGLDVIQGEQKATVTVQIRRDGTVFPLTYLPRGETTDAYQWRRIPGVPDKKCGI